MAPASSVPAALVSYLSGPQTSTPEAIDALEEYILHRRTKGDTLFDVSVGLAELEDRTPPYLAKAFDRARYVTNVPQPSDLSPPTGPFPLARSANPVTILHHLLGHPTPTIEHSREVILEFVLGREIKLKDKKPGRGGKGTLGRDGFEEIGRKLGEVEEGLRGGAAAVTSPGGSGELSSPGGGLRSPTSGTFAVNVQDLDENRKIGLALILSLRMSLSYFSLLELADQLLVLSVDVAERTILQHIRRRVAGEGRYGVGKELEYVEAVVLPRRPALKPAFRSAKDRALLPQRSYFPISLPAPSKSGCIKLINAFAKDLDARGPAGLASYMASNAAPLSPPPVSQQDKGYFSRRQVGSPITPATPLANGHSPRAGPIMSPVGAGSSARNSAPASLPPDANPLTNYTTELISEFVTREKRESMLKMKWAKSGRDQLSKELGEIESSVCMSGKHASPLAPVLLPVFLLIRRTFHLPRSPLPASITDPYFDILPAPPDPDEVPFREPSVQTTTATLYVNPRLDDDRAMQVIEELVENEKEKVLAEDGTHEEMVRWVSGLIDAVQKRFPDGSYENVFAATKANLTDTSPRETTASTSRTEVPRQVDDRPRPQRQGTGHRRAVSNAAPLRSSPPLDTGDFSALVPPPSLTRTSSHTRSASMPTRKPTFDEDDDRAESDTSSSADSAELATNVVLQRPILAPLATAQAHMVPSSSRPSSTAMPIPAKSPQIDAQPSVLADAQQALPRSQSSMLSPGESLRSTSGGGGWWDIVSAIEPEEGAQAPWGEPAGGPSSDRSSSVPRSPERLPLPPGAEPTSMSQRMTPPYDGFARLDFSSPPRSPPSPSRGLAYMPNGGSVPSSSAATDYPFSTASLAAALERPSPSAPSLGTRVISASTPTRTPVAHSPARTPLATSPARRTTSLNAGALLNGSRPPTLDPLPPVPPIPAMLFQRQDSSERLPSLGSPLAPLTQDPPAASQPPDSLDEGEAIGLAMTREPERPRPRPVPTTIHRPSFPSPSTEPRSSKIAAGPESSGAAVPPGFPQSAPLTASPSAPGAFGRHAMFSSSPSAHGSPSAPAVSHEQSHANHAQPRGHGGANGSPPSATANVIQMVPVASPPGVQPQPTKSKLFTRSKSFASKAMGKSSSAGAQVAGSGAGKDSDGSPVRPGKWDRSMVADIMGPSAAERRNFASHH